MSVPIHHTDNRQKLQKAIMKTARTMFFKQGIKSVRMDDIAHKLGISKRTLYEVFSDKEELLMHTMKYNNELHERLLHKLRSQTSNVLEVILLDFKHRMEFIAQTNEIFFLDLERYPKVLAYFKERRFLRVDKTLAFYEQGVKQGLFIPNINYNIVLLLEEGLIDGLSAKTRFKGYDMPKVLATLLYTHLRGIATACGQEILDSFYNEYQSQ